MSSKRVDVAVRPLAGDDPRQPHEDLPLGRPLALEHRRRVVRHVARRELVERQVVVRLLERLRRGQDHVGVAGRLVHVDVDREHEVERLDRALEPAAVRRRDERVAGDRDERAHLALARACRSPRPAPTRAARRSTPAARARGSASARTARPSRRRPAPGRVPLARPPRSGNIAPPSRSRLPVSTFSTSTSQLACVPNSCVQVPIRAYTARALGCRQLARHPPDLARPRCRRRPPPTPAGTRAPARAPRRARSRARRARPTSSSSSSTIVHAIAASSSASVPGRMKWCSSASSAVRVRRGSTTTTLPPRSRMRAQPPAHVRRGEQAAVRHERVGAQDQQVVAAVHVRDRHRQHRAEHEPGGDLLRHLVDRRRRVDVAATRARAASAGPCVSADRLWAFGLPR